MKELKYFGFSHTNSQKEAGIINQVQDLVIELDRNLLQMYQKNYDIYPDEIPDYTVLKLHNRAKLTDVLSANKFIDAYRGLIVNKKVKNILETFKSNNFRFYNAKVTDCKFEEHEYFVAGVNLTPEIIDFPSSEFMITDSGMKINIEPVSIQSYEDIFEKRRVISNIKMNKILMNEYFDLMRLPLYYRLLVSERLADILTEEKVTGMSLYECEVSFFAK